MRCLLRSIFSKYQKLHNLPMGKILTWDCKVKPRGVPKIWPIAETGRANILNAQLEITTINHACKSKFVIYLLLSL